MKTLESIGNEPRRTGRSIRLIDEYIQDLFKNKHVIIEDHWIEGKPASPRVNKWMAQKFLDRIISEHPDINVKFNESEKRRGVFIARFKNTKNSFTNLAEKDGLNNFIEGVVNSSFDADPVKKWAN